MGINCAPKTLGSSKEVQNFDDSIQTKDFKDEIDEPMIIDDDIKRINDNMYKTNNVKPGPSRRQEGALGVSGRSKEIEGESFRKDNNYQKSSTGDKEVLGPNNTNLGVRKKITDKIKFWENSGFKGVDKRATEDKIKRVKSEIVKKKNKVKTNHTLGNTCDIRGFIVKT